MKKPGTRPGKAAAKQLGGDNCYRFMAVAMAGATFSTLRPTT